MTFEEDTRQQQREEQEQLQQRKENDEFQKELDKIIASLENEQFQEELDALIERPDQTTQHSPSIEEPLSSYELTTEEKPESNKFEDLVQSSENQSLSHLEELIEENHQFQEELDEIIEGLHQSSSTEEGCSSDVCVSKEDTEQSNILEESPQTSSDKIVSHLEELFEENRRFQEELDDINDLDHMIHQSSSSGEEYSIHESVMERKSKPLTAQDELIQTSEKQVKQTQELLSHELVAERKLVQLETPIQRTDESPIFRQRSRHRSEIEGDLKQLKHFEELNQTSFEYLNQNVMNKKKESILENKQFFEQLEETNKHQGTLHHKLNAVNFQQADSSSTTCIEYILKILRNLLNQIEIQSD